jgi:hypothetical protein
MKRELTSIILVIGLVMMPAAVISQENNFGIKGGLTWSNLYIDHEDIDDENARLGFHAGIFNQHMMTLKFGMQVDLLYTTKGSEAEYTGILDQSVSFNIDYIDLPVMMVFRPVPAFEIHAGPYAGVLLNSNVTFDGTFEGVTELDRDHFRNIDAGLVAGLTINLVNLKLGARYNLGLRDIADSDAARLLLGESKNQYLQVFLALQFQSRPRY